MTRDEEENLKIASEIANALAPMIAEDGIWHRFFCRVKRVNGRIIFDDVSLELEQ